MHVATDFGSRPGVGFDESAPGQNRRRNAFGPEKRMRLNLHRSAQAEVVVLGDYTFGVQDSANRLDRFTTRRACQQLRDAGQVDPHVKSGARHIRPVIEFSTVVTFGARLIIELHLKGTAVDCASIPDEINPFRIVASIYVIPNGTVACIGSLLSSHATFCCTVCSPEHHYIVMASHGSNGKTRSVERKFKSLRKNITALKELSMFVYIDQRISKAPIQNG